MYLHLLSQITVNCQTNGDQISTFEDTDQFLGKNIDEYLNMCLKEDLRKKILNQPESGQKNMIF